MPLSFFTKKSNSFSGNVLKLVSGTAIAQGIAILAAPVLTRLFEPDAWGILAIFVSITGILGVISCMRYELAIMLPENDEEAANLFGVCVMSSTFVAIMTVPVIWLGKGPIVRWLNAPDLAPYLWLIPVTVFIGGIFLALNYWNSRTKHFGRLSIANIVSSLSTTLGKLGFGFAGFTTAATMVGATIAGQAISTSVLGGQIWRDDRKMFSQTIHWQAMWNAMKRYKKFPIFDTWAALMNTISLQLPGLLLAFFFSPTIVGFYALGYRLLSIPMSLIGGSIAQVFFQRAAVSKNEGNLDLVVRKVFTHSIAIGMFPIILVMLSGQEIFAVIFGNKWATAGLYAQILAPWIMIMFIVSPISTLFSILQMQRSLLIINVFIIITRVAALVIGGLADSIIIALVLYSVTGAIINLFMCLFIISKTGLAIRFLALDIFKICFYICIALLPVIITKVYGVSHINIFISVCLSLIVYYTIVYVRQDVILTNK